MPTQTLSPIAKRILLVVCIGVVLVLGIVGIRRLTRNDVFVRTAKAAEGNIVSSVSTTGKVQPVQLFQAHAETPGQVQAIYVRIGQQVAAGTLLLRMNTADAEARVQTARTAIATADASQQDMKQGGSQEERLTLQGDIARAKLQLDQARQELAALQTLQARGAASANEIAASRERMLTAQSSLSSLQQRQSDRYTATDRARVSAQVAEGQASLNAAESQLSQGVVRTTVSGTVFSMPVRPLDFVNTGEELVQVADLNRMQLLAYFDEPDIGKLSVNDQVVITWDARPGKQWHGHIVRVPTTVMTYGTRYVGECLIAIDDATGDLLPNTNVTALVTTQQVFHVLTIPREALRTETQDPKNFVYVVSQGVLHKTAVSVGALNLQSVQITGGLSAGDTVALNSTGDVDLSDGLQVKETH